MKRFRLITVGALMLPMLAISLSLPVQAKETIASLSVGNLTVTPDYSPEGDIAVHQIVQLTRHDQDGQYLELRLDLPAELIRTLFSVISPDTSTCDSSGCPFSKRSLTVSINYRTYDNYRPTLTHLIETNGRTKSYTVGATLHDSVGATLVSASGTVTLKHPGDSTPTQSPASVRSRPSTNQHVQSPTPSTADLFSSRSVAPEALAVTSSSQADILVSHKTMSSASRTTPIVIIGVVLLVATALILLVAYMRRKQRPEQQSAATLNQQSDS